VDLMKTLGLRTAEFHKALALPDEAGAFGSEPAGGSDVAGWAERALHAMTSMYDLLAREMPYLPDDARAAARDLYALRTRLQRRILRVGGLRPEGMKTRCHGDYHLGQVWVAKNDFMIANYGGGTGLSWEERRRKHMPLYDVACMMYSLGRAGTKALEHVAGDSPEAAAALQGYADDWEALARRAFFRSYSKAMTGHSSHLGDRDVARALLALFVAERAIADASAALLARSPGVGGILRRLLREVQHWKGRRHGNTAT
jgi:maltose alpha-D-glucosyltransferase/alpha-amylase